MLSTLPVHIALLLILSTCCRAALATPVAHHELEVALEPNRGWLQVRDTVQIPEELSRRPLCWTAPVGLEPRLGTAGLNLIHVDEPVARGERYCLASLPPDRRFTLEYAGQLRYPILPAEDAELAPVSARGVYLDGDSLWYPRFGDERVSLRLTVQLPADWRSVAQGARQTRTVNEGVATETWQENQPQDDIYLVAAPFHEYTGAAEPAQALVFLRRPDPELAQRYLQATTRYLDFYSRLLGPYAYSKFALVENFWETGFGMPSFTLLGSRVIRLPFILQSSYPHEILHNWWGNGVYVDYATGNWSEGLTAYLADHLFQEQDGAGAAYRRAALQRYANYVNAERDFPLSEFRARHGEVTQAVGYDKGLMFFHMLRQRLGDEVFRAGLRRFYRDQIFQIAGFEDLRAAFEAAAGVSLAAEFEPWVTRAGAPALRLSQLQTYPEDGGFRLTGVLEQTQAGAAYPLWVPLAVQLDREQAWQTTVLMTDKSLKLALCLPERPWRLAVDPEFDLMRRLDRDEMPPSLSQVFGAERLLLVLPEQAGEAVKSACLTLARQWAEQLDAEIVWDSELNALPPNRGIWLFGWENRFRSQVAAALPETVLTFTEEGVVMAEKRFPRENFGLVLTVRHPGDPDQAVAWLAWDDPAGLAAMARKLRHYGQYSYLAFTGDAVNVLKGEWPMTGSPLNQPINQWDGTPAPAWKARLAPRTPLAAAP